MNTSSKDEVQKMTMMFMKKYRTRLSYEMNVHKSDNSFYISEISDLDQCISSLCYHWYKHEWEQDEFEVNGDILKVTLCSICETIKS